MERRRGLALAVALSAGALAVAASVWLMSAPGKTWRYRNDSLVSLNQTVTHDPNDGLAWRELGLRLARDGDGGLAEPALANARRLLPGDPEVATALGEILSSRGAVSEAFQILKSTVETSPKFALGHMALGNLYRRRGSYHKAAEQFEAVSQLDPKNSEAHYSRAFCYLQMQQTQRAETEIQEALRLSPGDPQYLRVRASVFAATGRTPQALDDLTRAVTAAPENVGLKVGLATLLVTESRNEADLKLAQQTIESISQKASGHPLIPYLRGRLSLAREEWDTAVLDLEEARQTSPDQEEVYFALSQAYRRVGRTADADATLTVYRQRQELRRRIEELQIRLAIEADRVPIYLQIADLQLKANNTRAAVASLESALSDEPNNAAVKARLEKLTGKPANSAPLGNGGEPR